MVPDSDQAWHCMGANQTSIGIEHVGSPTDGLTPAQTTSSIALIKWLMAEYEVSAQRIFGHDFTPGYNRPGGTSCPDRLFGSPCAQKTIIAWLAKNGIQSNPATVG